MGQGRPVGPLNQPRVAAPFDQLQQRALQREAPYARPTGPYPPYISGKVQTYPESLRFSKIGPNEIHLPVGNPRQTEDKYANYLPDHVRNFLDCIKTREQPIGPVDIGHRTASICNLGNIAMRLKRSIRWNPEAEEIIGDDEATALLSRPMRAPWHL